MSHERRIFFTGPFPQPKDRVPLSPDARKHLIQVLRLSNGAEVTAVHTESGSPFFAILIDTDTAEPKIEITAHAPTKSSTCGVSTLLFALCKGSATDTVIDVVTELGVEQIIIWQADHSVVKLESDADRAKKLSRWQKLSETAGKQSGRDSLPQIYLAKNAIDAIALVTTSHRFLADLTPETKSIASLYLLKEKVCIAIGPEGDFSAKERKIFADANFQSLSLGSLRLRAETAAMAAVAGVSAVYEVK